MTNRYQAVRTATLLAHLILVMATGLDAASIGVNFTGDAHSVLSTDNPGVVLGDNWNNIGGATGAGIVLQDDTGTPTSATLTFESSDVYALFNVPATGNSGTNTMYSGGLVGFGNGGTPSNPSFTLSGIPYATYDLYTFASQDTIDTSTLSISDGTTAYYYRGAGATNGGAGSLLQTTSILPGAPTVGPAQYQMFTGLSGPVTVTESGSTFTVLSNNLFGIHVVDTTVVPAPSAFLLATIGLLSLKQTGRRRRQT